MSNQEDALLDGIGRRLERKIAQPPLFTLRWQLV
jgi:hypothetical protein